jgi:hypothetical protein
MIFMNVKDMVQNILIDLIKSFYYIEHELQLFILKIVLKTLDINYLYFLNYLLPFLLTIFYHSLLDHASIIKIIYKEILEFLNC